MGYDVILVNMIDSKSIARFGRVGSTPTIPKGKYMFENYKCFFMNDNLGNCNDFVSSDFQSEQGIIISLEEAVEFQKEKNKPILVYDNTNKDLVDYFVSIGGQISN